MSNRTAMSRRNFLALGGAAGAAAVVGSHPTALHAADENVLFFAYRGGINGDAEREHLLKPFGSAAGITVKGSSYPSPGQLKAMVQSKKVDVDVYDVNERVLASLVKSDLLQEIDYSLLAPTVKQDLTPGGALRHGVGAYLTGIGIIYNNQVFSEANHPRNWAEFWDFNRFPGMRTLPSMAAGGSLSPLEGALLADGVPADKLFPLDFDRAFRMLDRLRPHIVKFWPDTSDGFDLMMQGNADLAMLNFGRVIASKMNGEAKELGMERNQACAKLVYWVIPKGAPNPTNAHKMIAFSTDPKNVARWINNYPGYAPAVPKAMDYIEPRNIGYMINAPGHEIIYLRDDWWMSERSPGKTNYDYALERWAAWE